jgi:hypothetical protein
MLFRKMPSELLLCLKQNQTKMNNEQVAGDNSVTKLQGFFINQAAFKDAIKEQHLNNCDLA